MPINLDPNYYFEDREDAAVKLMKVLPLKLLEENETVVIGVSEGGSYLASEIAKATNSEMDILLTEAILAPNNPELTIAIVSETEEVVMNKALIDSFGISEDYVYSEAKRKYDEEVLSYVYRYRKGKDLTSLKGKYVVLVDECIETGLTMTVALKSAIEREAKNIYIATPILDKMVYQDLLSICDGVFCPYKIENYISIEYYYKNFETLSIEEIFEIMESREFENKREENRQDH